METPIIETCTIGLNEYDEDGYLWDCFFTIKGTEYRFKLSISFVDGTWYRSPLVIHDNIIWRSSDLDIDKIYHLFIQLIHLIKKHSHYRLRFVNVPLPLREFKPLNEYPVPISFKINENVKAKIQ